MTASGLDPLTYIYSSFRCAFTDPHYLSKSLSSCISNTDCDLVGCTTCGDGDSHLYYHRTLWRNPLSTGIFTIAVLILRNDNIRVLH